MRLEIPDELVAAVADAIAARLPRAASPPSPDESRYVTRKEAARDYRVELKALIAAERVGGLLSFRVGRRVLYRRSDVVSLVEGCVVTQIAPAVAVGDDGSSDPFDLAVGRARGRSCRLRSV